MICRMCEIKNINSFRGLNSLKKYKYRICKPCDRNRDKKWKLINYKKRAKTNLFQSDLKK